VGAGEAGLVVAGVFALAGVAGGVAGAGALAVGAGVVEASGANAEPMLGFSTV
jgi:hypothetical protein